ncbi:MAG TPA: hypothetical protein ENK82_07585, partial [Campylobacterales bacterium]|nr:hypothetical protein [Campylobacterales bacterium]
MFNLFLTLIVGVIIGWNFHTFFIQLNPIKTFEEKMSLSSSNNTEQHKTLSKNSKQQNEQNNSMDTLLKKNLFEDALVHYQEANTTLQPLYYSKILEHLSTFYLDSPHKAAIVIEKFQSLRPQDTTLTALLLKTYEKTETYSKAIPILLQQMEHASAEELDVLEKKLLQLSTRYINKLKESKNFDQLSNFLKKQIELGIQSPFYIYALSEHYVEQKKYHEAKSLLKEIEFDYDYEQKVKKLLSKIDNQNLKEGHYTYQLPLSKLGEHYILEVNVNETPLTLLLDTGATLTMINEDKLPILPTLNTNITLSTAGGEITAQLKEAERFSTGEIELKKFKIVSATYRDEACDGLLGMNFFKQFNFKIDQEKS